MGKKIHELGRYVMDGVLLGKGNFARVELATHSVTSIKVRHFIKKLVTIIINIVMAWPLFAAFISFPYISTHLICQQLRVENGDPHDTARHDNKSKWSV